MIFQIFSQINKKIKRQNLYSKNFILKHTILYIYCVDLLMWSLIKFHFMIFFVIYYNFSNI